MGRASAPTRANIDEPSTRSWLRCDALRTRALVLSIVHMPGPLAKNNCFHRGPCLLIIIQPEPQQYSLVAF